MFNLPCTIFQQLQQLESELQEKNRQLEINEQTVSEQQAELRALQDSLSSANNELIDKSVAVSRDLKIFHQSEIFKK